MNIKNYFKKSTILALILFLTAIFSFAQTANFAAPREEKLLNGLKLLVWNEPKAEKVTLKLRIHNGSAFDPQDKEGVMRLLSDILFPSESIKEFFAEDLGGSLEIISNYDYIQINASGDSDKFLTILETVSAAVTNPQITKENTEKVRSALLAKVKELEKNPGYVADQAVAKRLLGNFPYGRPQLGSSESLQKIDFADLVFAKERFLTADNATLTVVGSVKPEFALRATKRLFGGWLKADKKTPSTFAQPVAPDTKILIINSPNLENSELRYAFRGLARNDKDFSALLVWSKILQNRLREIVARNHQKDASIFLNSNLLPSLMVIKFSDIAAKPQSEELIQDATQFQKFLFDVLFNRMFTAEEFEKSKTEVLTEMNRKAVSDFWLDVDTFKLVSVKDEMQRVNNLTLADVQRVAERLEKQPIAGIVVKKSEETKQ